MNIKKGYIIPKCVELKKSPLHGLGVFATEFIPKGTELGVGHYFDFHNRKEEIVNLRTTLVPFFNYNIDSNLVLKQEKPTPKWECGFSLHNRIYTKRDIQKGEELLLKYSWYDPTKPDNESNKHYI